MLPALAILVKLIGVVLVASISLCAIYDWRTGR